MCFICKKKTGNLEIRAKLDTTMKELGNALKNENNEYQKQNII